MFSKRIPAYYLGLSALAGILFTYFIIALSNKTASGSTRATVSVSPVAIPDCRVNLVQMSGYQFIKPLLYSDPACESESLLPVKESINTVIEQEKKAGRLTTASVYIRSLSKGEWTGINYDEKYHPASLNKVAILITYMRMVERYNALLNEKLYYDKHDPNLPEPHYVSKKMPEHHSYTIQELLNYMIAYSDNDATGLLLKHINLDYYNKTFTDLGLPKPSFNFDDFFISAREYSLFMRVLYNASYLSIPASEFASEILTKCDFRKGLLKQLPPNIKAAHKFGESGYGNTYELHESAIIYLDQNPYLITVMTKGYSWDVLAEIISNISTTVYNNFAQNKLN